MKRTLSTILIIGLAFLNVFSQEKAQWRGENRDGKYNETGLLKKWEEAGPKMLWHYDNLGPGHASAAVTKDMVYTAGTEGENGFIIALSHEGKEIWKYSYGKEWIEDWDGVRSTPMVDGEKLYLMSGYGFLICLNSKTGEKIWSIDLIQEYACRNIKWGVTENLVTHGEKLFVTVGGIDANVIALNKETGKLIWKSPGKGDKSAYCSPVVINHKGTDIFVTMTENNIIGFDIKEGKMLWSFEWTNRYAVHANAPLYYDGYLYCVSGYGKGGIKLQIADDGKSVKEIWRNVELDNKMAGVILYDGKLYGSGDFKPKWFCLDWETGKISGESKMFKKGAIIYAEGLFYCYSQKGEMALVKPTPDSFEQISKFEIPYGEKQHWAHPVIYNKRLYVRHGTSLMVYDIAQK